MSIVDRYFQHEERIPGPAGPAVGLLTIEDLWKELITDEIFEIIVNHTNNKIENVCADMIEREIQLQTFHHHTDMDEMKAYVGLLYFAGAWKSSNVDVHELWNNEYGITMYRCVMSRSRFTFLSTCLRFDDKSTRNKDDRFAPIREIWTKFIANCQNNYNMSDKITVDEQLLSFRGRCIFRMYMKSKPDKYGLKIITLNDAETSYLYYGIPYLGKTSLVDQLPQETIPEYYLRKVTAPIHGSRRTGTCDNWFTSIPVFERFLEEPYCLTFTGTIRKNKREIPAELKLASPTVPDTKFCLSSNKNVLLLSHTPKKNKIVLVASTYLKSTQITNGKPNVILHYNGTKGGTDTFDQLCHAYTVTKRTNRWPVRYFYGILDQAAVNARVLLKSAFANLNITTPVKANDCLRRLSLHLVTPLLYSRLNNPSLRISLRVGIKNILHVNEQNFSDNERPVLDRKMRCSLCARKKDKKTQMQCPSCSRPMCDEHRSYICVECGGYE